MVMAIQAHVPKLRAPPFSETEFTLCQVPGVLLGGGKKTLYFHALVSCEGFWCTNVGTYSRTRVNSPNAHIIVGH